MAADYRFARSSRWILGHALVLGLVVLFVILGLWQLRRLDERRATNALVAASAMVAPEPLGALLDPDDDGAAVDALRFRAVVAEGRYTEASTSVRSTQGGATGGRVFTVLDLGGGESAVVLRGFAGLAADGSVAAPPPPSGEVEVEGLAVPRARLEALTRRALDELAADSPGLLPVIIQAARSDDPTMVPVPPPDLGEGPHLGYAVQWFLFAAVGVVGYPVLLRKRAGEAQPP